VSGGARAGVGNVDVVKIYVILATIAVALGLALVSASAAGAANSPHTKFDGVAIQLAGKPESVHCETDEYQWGYWESGGTTRCRPSTRTANAATRGLLNSAATREP
jgi:hypothetical protein